MIMLAKLVMLTHIRHVSHMPSTLCAVKLILNGSSPVNKTSISYRLC